MNIASQRVQLQVVQYSDKVKKAEHNDENYLVGNFK